MMKNLEIKNILINLDDIPQAGAIKNFTINGDAGAGFMLIVCNDANGFYDFSTQTFSTGHGPSKVLKSQIKGGSYSGSIIFPSIAGENYDLILVADPSTDSYIKKQVINKRITQLGNVTLTLSPNSPANSSIYKTLPSDVTASSNAADLGSFVKEIDWTFENVDGGLGLIISQDISSFVKELDNKCWFFDKTQTVDGTVSSSDTIILDSVDDLVENMQVVAGTGLSGTPSIISVDAENKTIRLSTTQSFSDGVTLTFRAQSISLINQIFNSSINFSFSISAIEAVTSTVRGTISGSTTVNLNGTTGITGGNIATYKGVNVNNSSANAVTSVSASASAGSMEVQLAQIFKGGEILTFKIASPKTLTAKIRIIGEVHVVQFPSIDRTIKMNLDSLFTPGSAT